jgi:hypothetical protein
MAMMKYKRLTPKDWEDIRRLYMEEEWTDKMLAEHYGRPLMAMRGLRLYHGISRREEPPRKKGKLIYHVWLPEEIEEIRRLYLEEGLSDKEIAARTGHRAVLIGAARNRAEIHRPLKMTYDAMRQRIYHRKKALRLYKLKLQNNGEKTKDDGQNG